MMVAKIFVFLDKLRMKE